MRSDVPTVRLAVAGDIAAMHALRLSVRENALVDPSRIGEADYLFYVESGTAWVAEYEGRISGFAALDSRSCSVWALFVDPAREGLGIGRALHDALIAGARESPCDELWLTTSPGTRAELFYERIGWRRLGRAAGDEIRFGRSLG